MVVDGSEALQMVSGGWLWVVVDGFGRFLVVCYFSRYEDSAQVVMDYCRGLTSAHR